MRVHSAHLARRLLRFIWVALLFVLGLLAVAALVLTPISFIAPFRADVGVSRVSFVPDRPGDTLAMSDLATPPLFFSSDRVALTCGAGGVQVFLAGTHVSVPGAVIHATDFDATLQEVPDGYPAPHDPSARGIGPNWLGLRWSYWSTSGRPAIQSRNAFADLITPLPLITVVCGGLPAIRLIRWWRRRKNSGRGFPVVTDAPAAPEPSPDA